MRDRTVHCQCALRIEDATYLPRGDCDSYFSGTLPAGTFSMSYSSYMRLAIRRYNWPGDRNAAASCIL
jgi:hypothetical protein